MARLGRSYINLGLVRPVVISTVSVDVVESDVTGQTLDAQSIVAAIATNDTGSSLEIISIAAVLSSSDVSSGIDASTISVAYNSSETGSGADSGSVSASLLSNDASSGLESSSISATLNVSEAVSATEASSLASSFSSSDTGSSSETASITVSIVGTDTASGLEDQLASGGTTPASFDTSSSIETSSIDVTLNGSDSVSGVEAQSTATTVSSVDTGSATETTPVGIATNISDSGSGTETYSIGSTLNSSDVSSGGEASPVSIAFSSSDIESSIETPSAYVSLNTSDSVSGTEVYSLELLSSDTVSSIETQNSPGGSTTPSGGDVVSGSETHFIAATRSANDAGTSHESGIPVDPDSLPHDYGSSLLMGPGSIYVADYGVTEPVNGGEPSAEWVHLGGLLGGMDLSVEETFKTVDLVQVPDIPFRRLISRNLSVKTSLAESTLANLAYVLNDATVATGSGYNRLSPTQDVCPATALTYRAVLIRGWAPTSGIPKRRTIIMRKCLSSDKVDFSYKKDDQTIFDVTWSVHYVDDSTSPFKVIDEV